MVASASKATTVRAPKSKPSSKPVGGTKRSCQEHAPPDTGTPKAMKDPNWRTRDAGSSTDSEPVMPHSDANAKLFLQMQQRDSSSQDDRGSSDFSIVDKYSSESSASDSFVKLLKKIDLKPVDGRQMSIFELDLRPETPTPINADDRRYVRVSRHLSSHHRDSSFATESGHSSHETDKIHDNNSFQMMTFDRLYHQSSMAPSHSQPHESSNIYLRNHSNVPLEAASSIPQDHTPAEKMKPSPQTAIHHTRDQAFQRLIQKLNRDNAPSTTQQRHPPEKPETQRPVEHEPASQLFGHFRKPLGGSGRRNKTISDFKVDYWDHGHSSLTSGEGSEDTVQMTSKQNTWNPKAREFLSLGHQQSPRRPLLWDSANPNPPDKARAAHPMPPSVNAAWSTSNVQPVNSYPSLREQDVITNGLLNPSVPSVPSLTPPGPNFNFGLGPETFAPTQYLSGTSAPPPPLFNVPPLSGIQAPIIPFGSFPSQQLTAQQVAAQQMAALPYLASLASLGPLPPLLSGLEKPTFPTNPRRPPVCKPTIPNAGAQLAYEEWIEWRKAHEPGYAVECKARQQRRSQRVKGPREDASEPRLTQARAVAAA